MHLWCNPLPCIVVVANHCLFDAGVDGCFIKLSSGQQILAATGRDGNNNLFPIAFCVVDKEDTPSWSWFLYQLKQCIEEGNKFDNYTFISDRQKVSAQHTLCTKSRNVFVV